MYRLFIHHRLIHHCIILREKDSSRDMYIVFENIFLYISLFLYVVTKLVCFAAHCAWLLCARDGHKSCVMSTSNCTKHQIQLFVFIWLLKLFLMMGGGGGAACFPTCLKTIYFTDKADVYCISDILHND